MSRLILKTSEGGVARRSGKQWTQERQLSKELHCVKKKVIRELASFLLEQVQSSCLPSSRREIYGQAFRATVDSCHSAWTWTYWWIEATRICKKEALGPHAPPHLATVRGLDVHVPPSQTVDLGFQSTGELDLQMKREELQCSLVVECLPSI